jgi:hypothetical protein
MTSGEATTARATSVEPRYPDPNAVLALALQHDEIDDDEIAVDRLALAELEHDRTPPPRTILTTRTHARSPSRHPAPHAYQRQYSTRSITRTVRARTG